jgi:class 3 adenylate cyclase
VKNARWMGPGLLDNPDELGHWISYTRLAASPSSAAAVMQNSSESDIREILPIVRTPSLVLHRVGDQIEPIEAGRYVAAKMPNARLVELPGDDGIPWVGDVDSVIAEIRAFLGEDPLERSVERRLATVLFTDIVGSTERAAMLGDARWREELTAHDDIAKRTVAAHAGRYVASTGDGLLATFDGPARAVHCAMAIADAVRPLGIQIRAGCHTGEIELVGDDIRGVAVHIGARVAALAGPDQVWASSTVKDLTCGSGLVFEDAGEHELKGVPDRWHLYRVVSEGA